MICFGLTDSEIIQLQVKLKGLSAGEKIAFWAERFVGVPYDPDPLGEYVSKAAIVADERVDCMYLTYRAVELALSNSPDGAVDIALDKRFHSKGVLKDGKVLNYADRFEYGEDMITSGKWGKDITADIGSTTSIKGSRGNPPLAVLSLTELTKGLAKLKSGDIIFLIKSPEKRKRGEVVGHIGIIKTEGATMGHNMVYMVHASGIKRKSGNVKKVLLKDYIPRMPFVGAKITRFDGL